MDWRNLMGMESDYLDKFSSFFVFIGKFRKVKWWRRADLGAMLADSERWTMAATGGKEASCSFAAKAGSKVAPSPIHSQ